MSNTQRAWEAIYPDVNPEVGTAIQTVVNNTNKYLGKVEPAANDNNRAPANDNLPEPPTDPVALKLYISKENKEVEEKIILLGTKGLPPEEYKLVFNETKQKAIFLLKAELRLAETLSKIKSQQGRRTDLNKPGTTKTKFEVAKEKYGLTHSQTKNIMKLTENGVKLAIEEANSKGEIPTRALAITLGQATINKENNKKFICEPVYSELEITDIVIEEIKAKEPIYYTQLFGNVGIGETRLPALNVINSQMNELEKLRCDWYREIFPDCVVQHGSITNKSVFDELVTHHLDNKVSGVHASPPCQDYSDANNSKKADSERAKLFIAMLDFIKAVDSVNQYVLIENVPGFINAAPKVLKHILGDMNIGEYIKSCLESLGYKVNIDIQNSADYGSGQSRERAIIIAHKKELWLFPKKDNMRKMLWEIIGHLPSIEAGEDSGIKYHIAPPMDAKDVDVIKRVPTGGSQKDNPKEWRLTKRDGTPSNAYFKSNGQRKDWGRPCNTITMDSGSISSHRSLHPGRPLSNGFYSDARCLSWLEIMLCSDLDPDYPIPTWASDKLVRNVIGEAFLSKHVKRLLMMLPR